MPWSELHHFAVQRFEALTVQFQGIAVLAAKQNSQTLSADTRIMAAPATLASG
jgi:hypothetical protein